LTAAVPALLRICQQEFFLPAPRIAKRITLNSPVLNRSLERLGEAMLMNSYRAKVLVAFISLACLACAAQAQPISKAVQAACKDDYKNYCGDYGLETSGLRSCMDRNGHNLSKTCVNALVKAGEVSQAEVDRRKSAGR
jgi:hypothetical protein